MIFVQPLYYNFLTTFSLILTLYSYSLSSFFSLYCFGPMKREKMKVVIKILSNDCTYITTPLKIHVFLLNISDEMPLCCLLKLHRSTYV